MRLSTKSAATVMVAALTSLGSSVAHAAPGDLVTTVNDGTIQASCNWSVRGQFYDSSTDRHYVRTKFTIKVAEIKPALAPRQVASFTVYCSAIPAEGPQEGAFGTSFQSNSSYLYRTRYLNGPAASSYQLCLLIDYRLRNGTYRSISDC